MLNSTDRQQTRRKHDIEKSRHMRAEHSRSVQRPGARHVLHVPGSVVIVICGLARTPNQQPTRDPAKTQEHRMNTSSLLSGTSCTLEIKCQSLERRAQPCQQLPTPAFVHLLGRGCDLELLPQLAAFLGYIRPTKRLSVRPLTTMSHAKM
jgi:hypothetical protein